MMRNLKAIDLAPRQGNLSSWGVPGHGCILPCDGQDRTSLVPISTVNIAQRGEHSRHFRASIYDHFRATIGIKSSILQSRDLKIISPSRATQADEIRSPDFFTRISINLAIYVAFVPFVRLLCVGPMTRPHFHQPKKSVVVVVLIDP